MSLEFSTNPVEFLATELKNRTSRNPRYSLRAFAHALKLSPGELSEILRGKRKITVKAALKIAQALGLNPQESQTLISLVRAAEANELANPALDSVDTLRSRQLTADLFHLVSDWYCFSILNLADTYGFSFEPRRIARRLGISENEARIALERLERVGLIERIRKDGRELLQVTPDYVLSPNGIPSEAVRNFHRQILEKARIALDEQSVEEREISGISFAIDPAELPKLKKEIHAFLDRCVQKVSKQDPRKKTEVYHFETVLFRLSKPEVKSL